MFVTYEGTVMNILRWQRSALGLYAGVALAVVLVHDVLHEDWFELPSWPLAVVGGVIGIFVSFRTNSGYDRWWEGRKLWGRLVNVSRVWSTQVQSYLRVDEETKAPLLRHHIAYVYLLRTILRKQEPAADATALRYLEDGMRASVLDSPTPTYALLHDQMRRIVAAADAGALEPLRLQSMDQTFVELLAIQGGCERIRNTPFPRGYGFVARRLIETFGILLPLALVDAVHWGTIPINILVCMSFMLVSEIGRVLEDPFLDNWPALPLDALCRTIERDVRHRLGELPLPAAAEPNEMGILM